MSVNWFLVLLKRETERGGEGEGEGIRTDVRVHHSSTGDSEDEAAREIVYVVAGKLHMEGRGNSSTWQIKSQEQSAAATSPLL